MVDRQGEDDGSSAEKSTSDESGDEPSQKEVMQSIRRGEVSQCALMNEAELTHLSTPMLLLMPKPPSQASSLRLPKNPRVTSPLRLRLWTASGEAR